MKIIEARENLSVQVHPSRPGETKNECWVVLDPPASGLVYAGLAAGATVEAIARARVEDLAGLLVAVRVAAGDAVVLPSGIVHALTAGALVYEVSEPRDVTYRIHDWGRSGRAMHVAEAAAAVRGARAGRLPAPAAPGAHVVPAEGFRLVRHVGPCALEARPGRAYTRLRGEGRGETVLVETPTRLDVEAGEEIAEAAAALSSR